MRVLRAVVAAMAGCLILVAGCSPPDALGTVEATPSDDAVVTAVPVPSHGASEPEVALHSDAARACAALGDECPAKVFPSAEEVRAAIGPKVLGELVDYWETSGGAAGRWGTPVAGHSCSQGASGQSCWQPFQNGTIRWREGTGVIDCAVLRCVALTFDDGPAADTPRLLDTLRERNVQATFYLLGHRMFGSLAEVMPRYAELGMEVGNHTWNHPDLRHISSETLLRELSDTNARIEELAGVTARTLRPPYGAHNSEVDALAGSLGFHLVGWSAGPEDWKPQSVASLIDGTASSSTRGSVILLHDTYPATVDAVPGILDALEAQGLVPVTVEDMFGPLAPGTFVAAGQRDE